MTKEYIEKINEEAINYLYQFHGLSYEILEEDGEIIEESSEGTKLEIYQQYDEDSNLFFIESIKVLVPEEGKSVFDAVDVSI